METAKNAIYVITPRLTANQQWGSVQVCSNSNPPCWKPVFNPVACPTAVAPQNIEIFIARSVPAFDTTAIVRCALN